LHESVLTSSGRRWRLTDIGADDGESERTGCTSGLQVAGPVCGVRRQGGGAAARKLAGGRNDDGCAMVGGLHKGMLVR
jgi:hypothetical protein